MNQANETGPLLRTSERMNSISAELPVVVFNAQRSTLNAQLPRFNLRSQLSVGRWALSVGRLLPTFGPQPVVCLFEIDQHISKASAGLPVSGTLVSKTVVLRTLRCPCGGRRVYNGFRRQSRG